MSVSMNMHPSIRMRRHMFLTAACAVSLSIARGGVTFMLVNVVLPMFHRRLCTCTSSFCIDWPLCLVYIRSN